MAKLYVSSNWNTHTCLTATDFKAETLSKTKPIIIHQILTK